MLIWILGAALHGERKNAAKPTEQLVLHAAMLPKDAISVVHVLIISTISAYATLHYWARSRTQIVCNHGYPATVLSTRGRTVCFYRRRGARAKKLLANVSHMQVHRLSVCRLYWHLHGNRCIVYVCKVIVERQW